MLENESDSSPKLIPVIMDDREPRDSMMQALLDCNRFAVEVQHLAVGDYLIDNALLVERKTLPDLVRSIIDGRLFQQALRLVEAEHPAVLILEGSASDLAECGMSWEAIQGALVTITLFLGLPILRSRCPNETARTFLYAAQQRRTVSTDTLVRHARRPKKKAALAVVHSPGIAGHRAEAGTGTDREVWQRGGGHDGQRRGIVRSRRSWAAHDRQDPGRR